jgi:hypothetical protein
MDLPLIQKENISDIELFRLFYHYTTGEQLDEEQSGLVALALEKLSKGEEA